MSDDWWLKVIGKDRKKREDNGDYCPDKRDSFYVKGRGSGWVIWIDYSERTVLVGYADHSRSTYRWDEIEDKFSPTYGGIWCPDY